MGHVDDVVKGDWKHGAPFQPHKLQRLSFALGLAHSKERETSLYHFCFTLLR